MTCDTCRFATPRRPRKLRIEQWEEDKRPIAPSGWHWFLNPNKYKDKDPYEDPYDRILDDIRRVDNENMLYCDRFPTRQTTVRTHICGEYKPKDE